MRRALVGVGLAAALGLAVAGCGTAAVVATPVGTAVVVAPAPSSPPPVTLSVTAALGCTWYPGNVDGNYSNPSWTLGACSADEANSGPSGTATAGLVNSYQITAYNMNTFAVGISSVTLDFFSSPGNEIGTLTVTLPVSELAAGATNTSQAGSEQGNQLTMPVGATSVTVAGWSP